MKALTVKALKEGLTNLPDEAVIRIFRNGPQYLLEVRCGKYERLEKILYVTEGVNYLQQKREDNQ